MTGQYTVSKEHEEQLIKIVEEYITSYYGDLFEDNDISIGFAKKKEHGKSWAYVQID